jgi:hypothetical protein
VRIILSQVWLAHYLENLFFAHANFDHPFSHSKLPLIFHPIVQSHFRVVHELLSIELFVAVGSADDNRHDDEHAADDDKISRH